MPLYDELLKWACVLISMQYAAEAAISLQQFCIVVLTDTVVRPILTLVKLFIIRGIFHLGFVFGSVVLLTLLLFFFLVFGEKMIDIVLRKARLIAVSVQFHAFELVLILFKLLQ